jgi:hypothetical protein
LNRTVNPALLALQLGAEGVDVLPNIRHPKRVCGVLLDLLEPPSEALLLLRLNRDVRFYIKCVSIEKK